MYRNQWIEFLVEEQSMAFFLEELLPEILPADLKLNVNCFIRPHNGKSDLQKSIPKKVQAYKSFPNEVKLVVIQDQDSNDCKKLKQIIRDLIELNNTLLPFMIRIACTELENWYLGDLEAVEAVYPESKASKHLNKAKYRNPDNLGGTEEMEKLVPNFSKTFTARNIVAFLDLPKNRSHSFQQLLSGLQKFL